MKNMKKLFSLLLALVMVLGLAVSANAVDGASITIKNAANGEKYSVVKIFDASVTGTEDGSIVYTGTIPDELSDYFEVADGNVVAKPAAKDSNGDLTKNAIDAITAWAETQKATATQTGAGGAVTFTDLEYGYYAVLSTQGTAVTVTSTNPNATVYDKNSSTPTLEKKVDDADVDIGQTVTYTVTAGTANYLGEGTDSEIVTQYVIYDTLPAFLSNVTVTGITIGGEEYKDDNDAVPQFDSDQKITIPWAEKDNDGHYVSKYENGAKIVIIYTAKVTSSATIDGAGNKNEVTLTPYTTPDDGTPPTPWKEPLKDEEIIYTYAAALRKVDQDGNPLAGATFAVNGLIVTGDNGLYVVSSYTPSASEAGTTMKTDDNGYLVIEGLNSGAELTVSEVAAPAGYNKLTTTVPVKPIKVSEEVISSSGTVYYDADGNKVSEESSSSYSKIEVATHKDIIAGADNYKVINNKGTELPSTGGMGTTMIYTIGGILVVAAVVLLVTKKRMAR